MDIKEGESYSTAQACSIQQSHLEGMQCLKMDALEEEGRDCLSFLSTCGVALQACPPNALGILMYPLHLLTGNMPLAALLSLPHQASTTREESTLMSTLVAPAPSPGAKLPHLPNQMSSSPLLEDAAGTNNEPNQKHSVIGIKYSHGPDVLHPYGIHSGWQLNAPLGLQKADLHAHPWALSPGIGFLMNHEILPILKDQSALLIGGMLC